MIGFIGGGNMAEALVKGMVSHGLSDICVSVPRAERRQELEQRYGIRTTGSNRETVSLCNIIILAVKPQIMDQVLEEISSFICEDKTVVSIAAGITLSWLGSRLKTGRIVRVMPNTPAIVQEGMSVLSLCDCFPEGDISVVREIFMSVGRVITLPEKYMNAVTALSGSGPAFYALFTEALISAGVSLGLGPQESAELAIQTMIGTAKLLDTGMSPEDLRKMVTSPGGTTAAGLAVFEQRGLKDSVTECLKAAHVRAGELGRKT